MGGLVLLALGGVSAFIGWGIARSMDPARKASVERERLAKLKKKPLGALTLEDAEDGLVLSRRYGDKFAGGEFAKHVVTLKKKRIPI